MKNKLSVTRRSKQARETVKDLDYIHKLNDEDKLWLTTFMRATVGNSLDDMADLVGHDKNKLATLQKQIYAEDNAYRRDMMNAGNRVLGAEQMEEDEAHYRPLSSQDFQDCRCYRCMKTSEKCVCPARQRKAPYGVADYTPAMETEDSIQGAIDLRQRMEAFDLLPYGDSPKDLQQGHAVKVCLPHHLLSGAWGYVLDYCPNRVAYMIRSMSRQGLRDRDGTLPKATVVWIKVEGLKRYALRLAAKDLKHSSDT